jgi:hypothetical protein
MLLRQQLAADLIRTSTTVLTDHEEASAAHLDLTVIVRRLSAAAKPGQESSKAIWQEYQHHFKSDQSRAMFFMKLRRITRRAASELLARNLKRKHKVALKWDRSLLPESTLPHVLRLAILHPRLLERFLHQFFLRASDCIAQTFTHRRAILILDAVPWYGWSAEKHTEKLIKRGSINRSEAASEVEKIKKFIRDLRNRHKTYIAPMLVERLKQRVRDLRHRHNMHGARAVNYTGGAQGDIKTKKRRPKVP